MAKYEEFRKKYASNGATDRSVLSRTSSEKYDNMRKKYGEAGVESHAEPKSDNGDDYVDLYNQMRSKYESTDDTGSGQSESLYEKMKERYLYSGIDSDPSGYIYDYLGRVEEVSKKGIEILGGNSFDTWERNYNENTASITALRKKDYEIRAWLLKNREEIEQETYDEILGYLSEAAGYVSDLQSAYDQDRDYWRQFRSPYDERMFRELGYVPVRESAQTEEFIIPESWYPYEEKYQGKSVFGVFNALASASGDEKDYLKYIGLGMYDEEKQKLREMESQLAGLGRDDPKRDLTQTKIAAQKSRIAQIENAMKRGYDTLAAAGNQEDLERKKQEARQQLVSAFVTTPAPGSYMQGGNTLPSAPVAAAQQDMFDTEEKKQWYRTASDAKWMDYVQKYTGKRFEDTFGGRFGANYTMGRLGMDSALAWSGVMSLQKQEDRRMADTADELQEYLSIVNEAPLTSEAKDALITRDLAQYLPQWIDQMKYQAVGAVLLAPLGSKGAKAGYVAGSTLYGYQTMAGSAYGELIKAGVDHETARNAARNEGILSSMVECVDSILEVATLGSGKAIDLAAGKGIKSAIKAKNLFAAVKKWAASKAGKNMLTKVATGLTKLVVKAGGEYAEEWTQEAISAANQEGAGQLNFVQLAENALANCIDFFTKNDQSEEGQTRRAQMHEAGIGGFRLGLITGGAQKALNAGVENTFGRARANQYARAVGGDARTMAEAILREDSENKAARKVMGKLNGGKQVSGTDMVALYDALSENGLNLDGEKIQPITFDGKQEEAAEAQPVRKEAPTQPTMQEEPKTTTKQEAPAQPVRQEEPVPTVRQEDKKQNSDAKVPYDVREVSKKDFTKAAKAGENTSKIRSAVLEQLRGSRDKETVRNAEQLAEAVTRFSQGKHLGKNEQMLIEESQDARKIMVALDEGYDDFVASTPDGRRFWSELYADLTGDESYRAQEQTLTPLGYMSKYTLVEDVQRRLVGAGMETEAAKTASEEIYSASRKYGGDSYLFTQLYDPKHSTRVYALAFDQAYTAGKGGMNLETAKKNYGGTLSDSAFEMAYKAGQKAGNVQQNAMQKEDAKKDVHSEKREEVKQEGKKEEERKKEDKTEEKKEETQEQEETTEEAVEETQTEDDTQSDEDTFNIDTGEAVEIVGFSEDKGMVETSTGEKINVEKISFADTELGYLYRVVSVASDDAKQANYLLRMGMKQEGASVVEFASAVEEAYQAGLDGFSSEDGVSKLQYAGKIDESLAKVIWKRGQDAREKQDLTERKKGFDRKGKLDFQRNGRKFDARREASLSVMKMLTKTLGVTIHVYESNLNAAGELVFRMNGEERMAPNGFYDHDTGEIWIDLNAGDDGNGTMLFTVAHELTHYIKDWNREGYRKLADLVVGQYEKSGKSVEDLCIDQMNKATEHGRNITMGQAFDEVVADSMATMLADKNAKRFLQQIAGKNQTLAQKITGWLKRFMSRIDEVIAEYAGAEPDSPEAKAMQQMEGYRDTMATWYEALSGASEAMGKLGLSFDAETESVSADTYSFSERSWSASEYVQNRDKAAAEIAKAIDVDVEKAKEFIDNVSCIAKIIASDRGRLDYESTRGLSSFVSNVEYGGSFDFTTLCPKRLLITGTFSEIQKQLPNTALTAEEVLDIRERMKAQELVVNCGCCYVEGSRASMGVFSKEFIALYKKYYPGNWQPNMVDVNTPMGVDKMRVEHPECYEQYMYFWNHYGTIRDGDKRLFASQQKPKLFQMRTEYRGEILTYFKDAADVKLKNIMGGIRFQSFSDFEIVHLIDCMQVIMDMARVGLYGQAYTKVPEFAMALGNTGLKINLSLIAKEVGEDGRLIFDDVEGMPIDTAMELRTQYSKNVGAIVVVYNDDQLYAAMADERIDFIIPFHRSQWKKSQYKAMGLPERTKDYTYQQNEKYIKPQYHEYRGRMVKEKATNEMPMDYWDFSKSGRENAELYLQRCAAKNKRPKFYRLLQNNGDGSYSLKADGSTDGYWKLLIDFKMYDNDGNGSPQTAVRPEFNMEEARRMLDSYRGGAGSFPVARGIVDEFVAEYKAKRPGQTVFSERNRRKTEAQKLQEENAGLMGEVETLRELVKLQSQETGGRVPRRSSVEAMARELRKGIGSSVDTKGLADRLERFYTGIRSAKGLDMDSVMKEAADISVFLWDGIKEKPDVDVTGWMQETMWKVYDGYWRVDALKTTADRYARRIGELRKRHAKAASMYQEAIRGLKDSEKESGKRIRALEGDLKSMEREFTRLSEAYDKLSGISGKRSEKISSLEKSLDTRKKANERLKNKLEKASERRLEELEQRKATGVRGQILKLRNEFAAMKDNPGKSATRHAPRALMGSVVRLLDVLNEARGTQAMRELAALQEREKTLNGNIAEEGLTGKNEREQAIIQRQNERIAKASKAVAELRESFKEWMDNPENGVDQEHCHAWELVQKIEKIIAGKDLAAMSSQELLEVLDTMKAVRHEIVNANKLFSGIQAKGAFEVASQMAREVDEHDVKHDGMNDKTRRFFMWQMRPDEFFQYLCGYAKNNAGQKIAKMFADGTKKQLEIQREFHNRFRVFFESEDKDIRKAVNAMVRSPLRKKVRWGLLDQKGVEVATSRGMMLQAYLLLTQKDSYESLIYGGFKLPNQKRYYDGDVSGAFSEVQEYQLYSLVDSEDLRDVVSRRKEAEQEKDRLTEEIKELNARLKDTQGKAQREALEAQKKELNAKLTKKREEIESLGKQARAFAEPAVIKMKNSIEAQLNETDRMILDTAREWYRYTGELIQKQFETMYGYTPKMIADYVPIHRDLGSVVTDVRAEQDLAKNLEQSGFLKDRVQSRAPIQLTDIFTELTSQRDQIARYIGFSAVQRDFNKIWNMGVDGMKLKGKVLAKFGDGKTGLGASAGTYIDNLIRDVAGGSKGPGGLFDSLYGVMAAKTLSTNLRVALSQAGSIPTAAAEVGWKAATIGYAKGLLTSFNKKKRNELAQRSAWYFQRYRGSGAMPEIADIRESGKGLVGRFTKTKIGKALTNWCQGVDSWATYTMWAMAESKAASYGLKRGTPEFKKRTAEIYEDIIRKTQPNYTATERSDFLRDKRGGVKLLTMFKTQANQNLNIVMSAALRLRKYEADLKAGKNGVTKADVRNARVALANGITGVLVGNMTLVAMRLGVNLLLRKVNPYRDEDDEVTWEAIAEGLVKDFASAMAGSIAVGGQIFDLVWAMISGENYYGISDSAISVVSEVLDNINKTAQIFTKAERDKNGKLQIKWDKVRSQAYTDVESVLGLYGLPVKNAVGIGDAIVGWYKEIAAGEFGRYLSETETTSKGQYIHRYVKAFREGESGKCEEYAAYLLAKYSDEKDPQRAMCGAFKTKLKDMYDSGETDAEEVADVLLGLFDEDVIDEDDVYWLIDGWDNSVEGEDYSRWETLDEIVYEGVDASEEVQRFIDHGVEKEDVYEHVRKSIKDWFFERSDDGRTVTQDEAEKLVSEYGGKTRVEAQDMVDDWLFEKENGYSLGDVRSTYLDGEISRAEAIDVLVNRKGKDRDEAEQTVGDWEYFQKTGVDVDELKSDLRIEKITRQQVIDALVARRGKSRKEAEIRVQSYEWEFSGLRHVSEKRVEIYNDMLKGTSVSKQTWLYICFFAATDKSKRDANGKIIRGEKTIDHVYAKIKTMSLIRADKQRLFYAVGKQENWSEKTMKKYKF